MHPDSVLGVGEEEVYVLQDFRLLTEASDHLGLGYLNAVSYRLGGELVSVNGDLDLAVALVGVSHAQLRLLPGEWRV